MPQIRQMDAHLADLIAAGEVVERPASVVKELVENAIDAGASAVTVEIRGGGMSLIRVTDNGCGIAPEELPTAFLRHATSKLYTESQLSAIGTLGFRGEALAAISAVSRLEIDSRTAEGDGATLSLEGGIPGAVEPAGVPRGTSVRVRDLFYNTPARLKFMKKDSAETAAVNGLMQHLALSHPNISFRFLKDGAEALHTPGDGKLDSAIYAALGRDFARGLLAVDGRDGDIRVSGFVTKPLFGRGSRGMQTFFVNGRFIKSQLLTAALEEAYRNQLMKGKFPGCVLAVTLPAEAVDVNVHPAKTQVKFAREREVFSAVYHTVLDALNGDGAALGEAAPKAIKATPAPASGGFASMSAADFREKAARGDFAPREEKKPSAAAPFSGGKPQIFGDSELRRGVKLSVSDSVPARQSWNLAPARPAAQTRPAAEPVPKAPERVLRETAAPSDKPVWQTPERQEEPRPAPAEQTVLPTERKLPPVIPAAEPGEVPGQQALTPKEEAPWRIVGELLHTYIVCEAEDESVWLIDKHAAHERVNFDRLMASAEPPMRQALLSPAAAELGREDAETLLENLPVLEELGFACEPFGGSTILVREIPADLDPGELSATLEELAEKLRTGRSPQERREALLHTMACKAAIKGGWVSDPAELQVLVEKVQSGAVRYCPHGRPVAVRLSKYELEKMFRRA